MIFVILTVVLLLIAAVLAYDHLTLFLNWLGRIKLGQITDETEWLDAADSVLLDWAEKGAPKVPTDENRRFKLIYDIKNIGKSSSVAYWQEAAVLKALNGENENSVEATERLVSRYIDGDTGEWISPPQRIDSAILAYELLSSGSVDKNFIAPAMKYTADMLKALYEKYGTVPYNENSPNTRFVDTVGMICPFMIKYAVEYDRPEFMDYAIDQIAQYRKFGFDEDMKMPFHCYDTESRAKLGICGWGRGCAWWAVGLTDSLKELMNVKGKNKEKTVILKLLAEVLDEMQKHISDDGSVCRMIFNESLADSSATAMLAYCYAYMYRLTKKDEYGACAKRMLGYLRTVTRRNGVIDFSQGDTMGIGYYSYGSSVVPAAQGFAVSAARSINKEE